MESEGYYSLAQTDNLSSPESKAVSKKKRSKKGKRFSDEQIKLLESIFKMENKLETKKKLQLARDLGLQPRQVAIWFQNRRARWKSKQIEEEYKELKASFDNLTCQFESLKKEKESLILQFERLSSLLSSPNESQSGTKDLEENGDNSHINDLKEGPSSLNERLDQHETLYINSNEEEEEEEGEGGIISSINEHKQESESFKFDEYGGGENSLASPKEWCNLDIGGLFSQPCSSTCKWWEF